jgi:hypothetical protein
MSGSFLAGPPREADKGGKRGIEGDFLLHELVLFLRSAARKSRLAAFSLLTVGCLL